MLKIKFTIAKKIDIFATHCGVAGTVLRVIFEAQLTAEI